jgi:hypothetical protein
MTETLAAGLDKQKSQSRELNIRKVYRRDKPDGTRAMPKDCVAFD